MKTGKHRPLARHPASGRFCGFLDFGLILHRGDRSGYDWLRRLGLRAGQWDIGQYLDRVRFQKRVVQQTVFNGIDHVTHRVSRVGKSPG
ncbi:hypothetical protein SDC9_149987 [bioreactor metagenome]|uniref:Uncharacterized protein n=1 Tax=bioreactor metagenome TaxID=1076179 RepID=A0A645ELA2_9ZZZZ